MQIRIQVFCSSFSEQYRYTGSGFSLDEPNFMDICPFQTSSHLDQHVKSHLRLEEKLDQENEGEGMVYHVADDANDDGKSSNREEDVMLVSQLDELNRTTTLFVKTTYEDLLLSNGNWGAIKNVKFGGFFSNNSVVDPKLSFSDPDPTLREISDPAPDPITDPT